MADNIWENDAPVDKATLASPWEADYEAFRGTVAGIGGGVTEAPTSSPSKMTQVAPANDIYKIQSGDNLTTLAANSPFTLGDLLAVNPAITDPAKVSIGQEITLPTEAQTTRPFKVTPEVMSQDVGILDFISKGEGGYNSSNRGTRDGSIVGSTNNTDINGIPLTRSTIGEIMQAQSEGLFAVGRYQMVPETFAQAVREAGLPSDAVFTPEVQDRLGLQLLLGSKRPALAAYLKGENDNIQVAMLEFAKEWASVPDPRTGKSYYESSGNKHKHTVDETRAILEDARAKLSPDTQGS